MPDTDEINKTLGKLEEDLSQVKSIAEVQSALNEFSVETGLKVMLQHNDIFQATHEITLH